MMFYEGILNAYCIENFYIKLVYHQKKAKTILQCDREYVFHLINIQI